jgi:hypothetical protein
MLNRSDTFMRQIQSSSALAFARALFHAGEGKELFDREFEFPSAVSTYYSLFHLGGALILAYCSHPPSTGDPHISLREKLEGKWEKRHPRTLSNGKQYLTDPAGDIRHPDVPAFLSLELPELAKSLGGRDLPGTLLDMREFVSYAPRMVSDGHISVLYSGCQYEPKSFRGYLGQHLRLLDDFFRQSLGWLCQRNLTEVQARILSGDFVLFEFDELHAYYPEPVRKRAWEIYYSLCENEKVNWRVYRPEPGTFHVDQNSQRRRYDEMISLLSR